MQTESEFLPFTSFSIILSPLTTAAVQNDPDYRVPDYMRIFYILIGTVGMTGNMFVFLVLFTNLSKSPNTTECLLLHQTVVDVLTSLMVVLTAAVQSPHVYLSWGLWENIVCRFWTSQVSL